MPEAPTNSIADHRRPDLLTHHETDAGWLITVRPDQQVTGNQRTARSAAAPHRNRELGAAPHPRSRGKHAACRPVASSDTDARAALPAPRGQDRAPGPRPHAQAEAMDLRPAAVVRLKRALAHGISRCGGSLIGSRMYRGQSSGHGRQLSCWLSPPPLSVTTVGCGTHPQGQPRLCRAALQLHRSYRTVIKVRATGGAGQTRRGQQASPGPSSRDADPRTLRFPERAMNDGPRLWIAQRAGASAPKPARVSVERPRKLRELPVCNVHMLWKKLLINCGGLGVTGR